jgi:hypothetical protein
MSIRLKREKQLTGTANTREYKQAKPLVPYFFKPGQSGNPNGRPKIPSEVIEACRAKTLEAIEILNHLMRRGYPDSVKLAAACAILDRAWGKPHVSVALADARDAQARIKIIRQNVGSDNEQTNVIEEYTRAIDVGY